MCDFQDCISLTFFKFLISLALLAVHRKQQSYSISGCDSYNLLSKLKHYLLNVGRHCGKVLLKKEN